VKFRTEEKSRREKKKRRGRMITGDDECEQIRGLAAKSGFS
jgi:hypothetical protein